MPWKTTSWRNAILYDFSTSWMQDVLAIVVNVALAMILTGSWWGWLAAALMTVVLYRQVPESLHYSLTMYHLWASVLLSGTFFIGLGFGLSYFLSAYAGLAVLPSVIHSGLAAIAWVGVYVPYRKGRDTMMPKLVTLACVSAVFAHCMPGALASPVFVVCVVLSAAWLCVPNQSDRNQDLARLAVGMMAYLAVSGIWGLGLCLSLGGILEGHAYLKWLSNRALLKEKQERLSKGQIIGGDQQEALDKKTELVPEKTLTLSEQRDQLLDFLGAYEDGYALFGGLLPVVGYKQSADGYTAYCSKMQAAEIYHILQTKAAPEIFCNTDARRGIDAIAIHDEWLVQRLFLLTKQGSATLNCEELLKNLLEIASDKVREIYYVVALRAQDEVYEPVLNQEDERLVGPLSYKAGCKGSADSKMKSNQVGQQGSPEGSARASTDAEDSGEDEVVYAEDGNSEIQINVDSRRLLALDLDERLNTRSFLGNLDKIALSYEEDNEELDLEKIKDRLVDTESGQGLHRAVWVSSRGLYDCNPVIADILGLRSRMQDVSEKLLMRWLCLLRGLDEKAEFSLPIKRWGRAVLGRILQMNFTVYDELNDATVSIKDYSWNEYREALFLNLSEKAKASKNVLLHRLMLPVAMSYFGNVQTGNFVSKHGAEIRSTWWDSGSGRDVLNQCKDLYVQHVGFNYLYKDEIPAEDPNMSYNVIFEDRPVPLMENPRLLETNGSKKHKQFPSSLLGSPHSAWRTQTPGNDIQETEPSSSGSMGPN